MRITWVTRSFLDYRIPVYAELDRLCNNSLTLIYNRESTSASIVSKVENKLGNRAIGLVGEKRLATTTQKNVTTSFANCGIRIPWQPGLLQTIRQSSPDVMVTDGFMQWTLAALWLHKRQGIPHVMCYERTAYTERHCQWYRRLYRKWAMRHIDAYSVNGSLCGEYLQSLGVPGEQITYGQMVADTSGLQKAVTEISSTEANKLREQYTSGGKIFLYVGQIIPRKGVKELLASWAQAHAPDDVLLLVGEGAERQMLENQNYANVFWLGRQPYDTIQRFYRIADVFIIPTLEDNWSLVVPEAMACGLPIACSKYNGCWPELVKPENGWVFDPLDQEDTIQTIKSIHEKNTSELREMGRVSEQIVSQHTPATAAKAIYQACQMAVMMPH